MGNICQSSWQRREVLKHQVLLETRNAALQVDAPQPRLPPSRLATAHAQY